MEGQHCIWRGRANQTTSEGNVPERFEGLHCALIINHNGRICWKAEVIPEQEVSINNPGHLRNREPSKGWMVPRRPIVLTVSKNNVIGRRCEICHTCKWYPTEHCLSCRDNADYPKLRFYHSLTILPAMQEQVTIHTRVSLYSKHSAVLSHALPLSDIHSIIMDKNKCFNLNISNYICSTIPFC